MKFITVFCKHRLDRPDLPKSQRTCHELVISVSALTQEARLALDGDKAHARLFDYGVMYFSCGHAEDKDNNALEHDIEESYKRGNW